MDISTEIKTKAPLILEEVKKANSILLHCHPSPDPDSVGSALATKFALEQLGKKVTLIKGDSDTPVGFQHFPGAATITPKNFFELNVVEFDLFIILDSGAPEMISRVQPMTFPLPMKTIVIDHHRSNTGYGLINLIDTTYPATAQILFDLFKEWGITITPEIAANLLMGMFTDTGGFKFPGTTRHTLEIAAQLVELVPEYHRMIARMENTNTPGMMKFESVALGSIETFFDGKAALALISPEMLSQNNISHEDAQASRISAFMRTVGEWKVVGCILESEPGKVKISFRSQDGDTYDVGKLAVVLGGGGHRAAAGVAINKSLAEVRTMVTDKIKELFKF